MLVLSAALSARTFSILLLPALVLLASAILAGRVFCAWACPLGTLFDLCGKKKPQPHHLHYPALKYLLLCALAAAALAGFNLAGLFDPISFITRVAVFIMYPAVVLLTNLGLDAARPLAEQLQMIYLARTALFQPLFVGAWLTIVLLALLLILNRIGQRFWCRTLCPLGALLGLFSRFQLFKRHVSSACNTCGTCIKTCPQQAIPIEPRETSKGECSLCGTCARVCPQQAIAYGTDPARPALTAIVSKRAFLYAAGAGRAAAFTGRLFPGRIFTPPSLLRPPGAIPEDEFLRRCVRCGQCMRVCPTNTLQPLLFTQGLEGLWTPHLIPRRAGCDQTCQLCGTVCPTDALRELKLEEKKHAKLGTAYLDKDRCLVWDEDRLCLICDEQCPYNAIVFQWKDGFRRPIVIENKCNGCGFCEEQCPVSGASAIIVTSRDEIRLSEGSYIEAARQHQLNFSEDPGDDDFFLQQKSDTLPQGFTIK
jgi:polyferredoxin